MASLLTTQSRLTLFPIQDNEVWEHAKKHLAAFWTAEELDFVDDHKDFQSLKSSEQRLLLNILAFFASSDTLVSANISVNFVNEISGLEAQYFYAMQNLIEQVHSETYSLQITTLVKDKIKQSKLFNAVHTDPSIKAKATWALEYMGSGVPLNIRLFAFGLMEGLLFQSSFAVIFFFRTRNKMPGLCKSNEFIARDEGLHCQFSFMMFKRYNMKEVPKHFKELGVFSPKTVLTEAAATEILKKAVTIEKRFVDEALDVCVLGMNKMLMGQFVECVADNMMVLAGFSPVYNTKNPFPFMETSGLNNKTNFFEQRVSEYQLSGVGVKQEESVFSTDVDF